MALELSATAWNTGAMVRMVLNCSLTCVREWVMCIVPEMLQGGRGCSSTGVPIIHLWPARFATGTERGEVLRKLDIMVPQ